MDSRCNGQALNTEHRNSGDRFFAGNVNWEIWMDSITKMMKTCRVQIPNTFHQNLRKALITARGLQKKKELAHPRTVCARTAPKQISSSTRYRSLRHQERHHAQFVIFCSMNQRRPPNLHLHLFMPNPNTTTPIIENMTNIALGLDIRSPGQQEIHHFLVASLSSVQQRRFPVLRHQFVNSPLRHLKTKE